MNVNIVGLGYVGLTLGVYLASRGYRVHGMDNVDAVLNSLAQACSPFFEKGLDSELSQAIQSGLFTFGRQLKNYDASCAYVITVGTPIDDEHHIRLDPIQAAAETVRDALKTDDLVLLRSTVKIGVTRHTVKPILDHANVNYYLAFAPERTVEGNAFEELSSLPQVVGGIDDTSTEAARAFFTPISSEVVTVANAEEAEFIKLINNAERYTMFAFANEIALMCEAQGLNAANVCAAAKYKYPRSSLKRPGLVGGAVPCKRCMDSC